MTKGTRWSEEEVIAFQDLMFARWVEKPMDTFARIASYVLNTQWPEHRKKVINGPTNLKDKGAHFFKRVRETVSKGRAEQNGHLSDESLEALVGSLKGVIVRDPVPYDPSLFMRAQSTTTLVQELFYRFMNTQERMLDVFERFEQRLTEKPAAPRPFVSSTPPVPNTPRPTRALKLRVGIIGLLNDQFQHVQQAIGDKAELRNIETKDGTQVNIPVSLDYLVFNSRFSNHKHFERAREQIGNEKIALVDGGVSTVTAKCFDLIARQ